VVGSRGNLHPGATAFLGVLIEPSGYFRFGEFQPGALVAGVVPASPAQQSGLVPGDVITSLDGTSVGSPTTLENVLLAKSPGSQVKLAWVDPTGTAHSATVKLASGPPQ